MSGKLCKFVVVSRIMACNVARMFEKVESWDSKWTSIFNSTLKIEAL
jgi:hypothetical protein